MTSKYGPLYRARALIRFIILVNLEMFTNFLCNLGLYRRRRARLPTSLAGKTVVITGGNAGIGKECAKTVFRLGASQLIIACRDQKKAKMAVKEILDHAGRDKKNNLILVELDLSSLASVRACAREINSKVTHIDVLLNNAGVMMCPEWKTVDGYEFQFGTNHLGHFLLTNLLIPKLKASPSARIVNVSAVAHLPGQIHWNNLNLSGGEYSPGKAYTQSKLANVLFTVELKRRLQKAKVENINVYSLHPGIIETELGRHFIGFSAAVTRFLGKIAATSPAIGAQTSLHCAFSPDLANQSGFYYE